MSASDVKTPLVCSISHYNPPKMQEEQESELKAKYPSFSQKCAASVLLQKRLNRGVSVVYHYLNTKYEP